MIIFTWKSYNKYIGTLFDVVITQFFFVAVDISLSIIKQPEQQHRARYQTEGSRGAVKDRDGNGFPIVQLSGYHKPATLQVSSKIFLLVCKIVV